MLDRFAELVTRCARTALRIRCLTCPSITVPGTIRGNRDLRHSQPRDHSQDAPGRQVENGRVVEKSTIERQIRLINS